MKKVGDLFAELGFRPDASDGAKRAFIENLVRAAGGARAVNDRREAKHEEQLELPKPLVARSEENKAPQQLSFALELGFTQKKSG